jgi:hypothetical protein
MVDLEDFEMERQQRSNWCWAAVSVSIARFFEEDSERKQCGIAGALRGLPCCQEFSRPCNRPDSLRRALVEVGRLDSMLEHPVKFDAIQKQIDEQLPVCVRFEWQGGPFRSFGHFAAIRGYDVSAKGPVVIVDDPFYGRSRRLYKTILNAYQLSRGKWTHTYLVNAKA